MKPDIRYLQRLRPNRVISGLKLERIFRFLEAWLLKLGQTDLDADELPAGNSFNAVMIL